MTFQPQSILLDTADLPLLGRDLGVLSHAHSARAVGHARNEQLNVPELEFRDVGDFLSKRAGLLESSDPVRKGLTETQLDPAHALDATYECQIAADTIDHSRGLDGPDHARRTGHHGRKRRYRRGCAGIHPYLAGDVAP